MPKSKKVNSLSKQEQELLSQAQAISDVLKTKGWLLIASFIQNSISWPDPKDYHSREEVIVPYSESYGASELARKVGNYVNSQEEIINSLSAKAEDEDGPGDGFDIGN